MILRIYYDVWFTRIKKLQMLRSDSPYKYNNNKTCYLHFSTVMLLPKLMMFPARHSRANTRKLLFHISPD